MLLMINFFGEHAPIEVSPEASIVELKAMIQAQTGVPVEHQTLTGIPDGVTDATKLGAAVADGDTVGVEAHDEESERQREAELLEQERLSMEAVRRMEEEDQMWEMQQRQQDHSHHPNPPQHYSNGMSALFGMGTSHPVVPEALRRIRDESVQQYQMEQQTSASSSVSVDEDEPSQKRTRQEDVHPSLAVSLVQLMWTQLTPHDNFSAALGEVRRDRKPLLGIVYNKHQKDCVSFLMELTSHLSEPDLAGAVSGFVRWVCDAATPSFDTFLSVVENNTDLQEQMEAVWSGTLTLPLILLVVPVPGSSNLQLINLLHTTFKIRDLENCLLQIIAEHSERLEVERVATTSERDILKDEQDAALQAAMEQDRQLQMQKQQEEQQQRQMEQMQREAEEEARRAEEEARKAEEAQRSNLQKRRKEREERLGAMGNEGSVRVALRLPNGKKVERRFTADARLETVYWFMDVLEDVHGQFEDTDTCSLSMNYPKRTLTLTNDGQSTFADLQLDGSVAFFVEN